MAVYDDLAQYSQQGHGQARPFVVARRDANGKVYQTGLTPQQRKRLGWRADYAYKTNVRYGAMRQAQSGSIKQRAGVGKEAHERRAQHSQLTFAQRQQAQQNRQAFTSKETQERAARAQQAYIQRRADRQADMQQRVAAANASKAQTAQARAQARAQGRQAKQQQTFQRGAVKAGFKVTAGLLGFMGDTRDRVAAQAVPSGPIPSILFVIILLLIFLVPAAMIAGSPKTRGELMWGVLLGEYEIPDAPDTTPPQSVQNQQAAGLTPSGQPATAGSIGQFSSGLENPFSASNVLQGNELQAIQYNASQIPGQFVQQTEQTFQDFGGVIGGGAASTGTAIKTGVTNLFGWLGEGIKELVTGTR
jgi:hypothetical protein